VQPVFPEPDGSKSQKLAKPEQRISEDLENRPAHFFPDTRLVSGRVFFVFGGAGI
jgi:hypothetical protein